MVLTASQTFAFHHRQVRCTNHRTMNSSSMKFFAIVITAAALALFSSSTRPERASSIAINVSPARDTIAITGATLIDGSGRAPVKDAVVIIKGDSIAAVGQRRRIKIPAD